MRLQYRQQQCLGRWLARAGFCVVPPSPYLPARTQPHTCMHACHCAVSRAVAEQALAPVRHVRSSCMPASKSTHKAPGLQDRQQDNRCRCCSALQALHHQAPLLLTREWRAMGHMRARHDSVHCVALCFLYGGASTGATCCCRIHNKVQRQLWPPAHGTVGCSTNVKLSEGRNPPNTWHGAVWQQWPSQLHHQAGCRPPSQADNHAPGATPCLPPPAPPAPTP